MIREVIKKLFNCFMILVLLSGCNRTAISQKETLSEPLQTIEFNKTKENEGYEITLEKVEYFEEDTKIYISISNNGNENIDDYSFEGKRSGESILFFENTETQLPDSIEKGDTVSGIVILEAIDYSYNWIFVFQIENTDEPIKIQFDIPEIKF